MTAQERIASKVESLEVIFIGMFIVGLILAIGGVGIFSYMLTSLP